MNNTNIKIGETKEIAGEEFIILDVLESGKIPDGHMVVMLDGNKLNTSIENLCCIPKSIAARMANGHGKNFWSEFPEVTKTAIEVCKLDEAINESRKRIAVQERTTDKYTPEKRNVR